MRTAALLSSVRLWRSSISESGITQTGTTDLGGSVYFDKLKLGAYQVREVSAPSGYVKDDQTYTVNVTSGTENQLCAEKSGKAGSYHHQVR